jgi:hypothetical protein
MPRRQQAINDWFLTFSYLTVGDFDQMVSNQYELSVLVQALIIIGTTSAPSATKAPVEWSK